MPVEIKELVIRAVVQAAEPRDFATENTTAGPVGGTVERDEIIAAAVRQTLRVLKAGKER